MEVGNLMGNDENLSDDEIFFGKMTLKEAKKLIFINYPQRQTISYSTSTEEQDKDDSIRIIETRSEPDIVEVDNSIDLDLKAVSSPDVICNYPNGLEVKPDDSFIRLEKMVSELCMSPTDKHPQLDNTLEVVDFILNNAEQKHEDNKVLPHLDITDVEVDSKIRETPNHVDTADIENMVHINKVENEYNVQCETDKCVIPNSEMQNCNIEINNVNVENTPNVDDVQNDNNIKNNTYITPTNKMENSFATEICNSAELENASKLNPALQKVKCNTNLLSVTPNKNINSNAIFKTPKNPVSGRKPLTSSKRTPNRVNAYQHITSPIASYIKNCPQVPLVKDVHPQRPLPVKSAIPQPIKSVSKAHINKENVQFPTVAYKSAKKTQMVSIPNSEKLPRGEWTNKLTSSLKKPVVITHGQRVMNNVKNLNKHQEDSFANLTLQQADLSVCTKKSAF